MSAIDAISMIQKGVAEITVESLNVGSSGNSYSFPETAGSNGQILVLSGDSLTWGSVGGTGTVTSVTGDANFIISNTTTTPAISLATNVEIDTLTIHNAYILPTTIGSTNQVLSVPSSGTTLYWQTVGGGTGDVTDVLGTSNQIAVTNSSGPQPQVGFPTGYDGIQFPNNIITNVSTQGSNSGTVSIGQGALHGITNAFTDSLLVGIGKNALGGLTSIVNLNQVVVGNLSAQNLNSASNYNVVCGNQSMSDPTNVSSYNNVVVGTYSGQNIASGQLNIIIGNSSLSTQGGTANTDVNDNIVIGHGSLQNIVGGGANNIILGNGVNVAVANDNGNFLVDPANITKMAIGNIISGDATRLVIPNMKNPFNVNPSVSGQLLSSDTSGNLSWASGPASCWIYAAVGATVTTNGLIDINSTNSQYSANISLPTASSVTIPANTTLMFNCYLNCSAFSGFNSVAITAQLTNITGYTTSATLTTAGIATLSGVINTGSITGSFGVLLTFSQIFPGSLSMVISSNSYFTLTKV